MDFQHFYISRVDVWVEKKAINSSRDSCCWIFAPNKTSYPPLRSNRAKDISTSAVVGILPYGAAMVLLGGKCPVTPSPTQKKKYIVLYTNNICRIILLNIYILYLSVLNIRIHITYIHKNYISFMCSCWYSTVEKDHLPTQPENVNKHLCALSFAKFLYRNWNTTFHPR